MGGCLFGLIVIISVFDISWLTGVVYFLLAAGRAREGDGQRSWTEDLSTVDVT